MLANHIYMQYAPYDGTESPANNEYTTLNTRTVSHNLNGTAVICCSLGENSWTCNKSYQVGYIKSQCLIAGLKRGLTYTSTFWPVLEEPNGVNLAEAVRCLAFVLSRPCN